MRITQEALKRINNQHVRPHIQIALKCSEASLERYIRDNKENGPLTTAAALIVIKERTGLITEEVLCSAIMA